MKHTPRSYSRTRVLAIQMVESDRRRAKLALILALFSALALQMAARGDSDVAVKKNSDGTVEVSDAPSKGASKATHYSEAPQQTRVIYRLKNDVGTRHINGVTVRTNPDGSIETTDGESRPEPISGRPAVTHRVAHTKHPAKTHK